MEPQYGAITSSTDPAAISTTVLSVARVIAGILVTTGVITAADDTHILSQVPSIITDAMVLAPVVYSMWNSGEVIFGIIKKGLVARFAKKNQGSVQPIVS